MKSQTTIPKQVGMVVPFQMPSEFKPDLVQFLFMSPLVISYPGLHLYVAVVP